ncbi:MAG: AsmA family protein [Burkholderiaceae bacterium]
MGLSKTARRRIGVSFLGAAVLLGTPLAATYLYVQSDGFRAIVSRELSTLSGQRVELGDRIVVDKFLPSPAVAFPDARFVATSGTIRRARIEGLRIAISPGMLVSAGGGGAIDLSADRVSVIADDPDADASGGNAGSNTEGNADGNATGDVGSQRAAQTVSEPAALPDLVGALSPLLDMLRARQATISIGSIDLIMRSAGIGSARYAFSDLEANASGGRIAVAARLHHAEHDARHVRLVIDELAPADAAPTSISGRIELTVRDENDDASTWTFTTPLKIETTAISLPALELKSPQAWLRGTLSLSQADGHPSIAADLELRRLELSHFLPAEEASAPVTDADARLFPAAPFASALPPELRADVRIQLGAIRMGSVPVANGQLRLSVEGGKASLSSDDLSILGGPGSLKINLDPVQAQEVAVRIRAEATAMQLDRLRVGIDHDAFISQGEADIIIALRGQGASPAQLAATLNGYALGSVKDALVNQKYSTLLDRGVVTWARERFSLSNSSRTADEKARATDLSAPLSIPCMALRLYVNDGRVEASNGLILETPDNTLYSSGYVDLNDETLGFAFRTRSRSMFDWSAISIIKYAEASGTLARPVITLNAVELAKQGLLTASSVAWGPLPGLVYSLAESGVHDARSRDCDVALR